MSNPLSYSVAWQTACCWWHKQIRGNDDSESGVDAFIEKKLQR